MVSFEFDSAFIAPALSEVTKGNLAGHRLRDLIGTRPAHFIAVTGYGQASDQAMSRDAGFDHHLVKPVDMARLQALLARPLGGL